MKFAVLNNNIVENIIIADSREDAEIVTRATCIEYTDENLAAVGWTYDQETGKFVSPVVPEEPAVEEVVEEVASE